MVRNAVVRSTAITNAYLGTEQDIPEGVEHLEIWAVDAVPATAEVDCWVRVTKGAIYIERKVPAGTSYWYDLGPGGAQVWTYNVRLAAVGNAFAQVALS